MDFGLKEARELISDPVLWPYVRRYLASGGEFRTFPKGVEGRLCLVDEKTKGEIDLWLQAVSNAEKWRLVINSKEVKELKERFPGIYPEVFRYAPYFSRFKPLDIKNEAVILQLLKLKFPEVYNLCSL